MWDVFYPPFLIRVILGIILSLILDFTLRQEILQSIGQSSSVSLKEVILEEENPTLHEEVFMYVSSLKAEAWDA